MKTLNWKLCLIADAEAFGRKNLLFIIQEDFPLAFARKLLGKNRLIGLTVNTTEEAIKAEEDVLPLYLTD